MVRGNISRNGMRHNINGMRAKEQIRRTVLAKDITVNPNEVVEKPRSILLQCADPNKRARHGAVPTHRHETAAVAGGSAGKAGGGRDFGGRRCVKP